jgi:hypothetical protein
MPNFNCAFCGIPVINCICAPEAGATSPRERAFFAVRALLGSRAACGIQNPGSVVTPADFKQLMDDIDSAEEVVKQSFQTWQTEVSRYKKHLTTLFQNGHLCA